MKLKLVSVGTRMPAWVQAGVSEYTKRLPADFSLLCEEVQLDITSGPNAGSTGSFEMYPQPGTPEFDRELAGYYGYRRVPYVVDSDPVPAALEAGAEYFFIEQDELYGRDAFDCIADSREYLKSIGY